MAERSKAEDHGWCQSKFDAPRADRHAASVRRGVSRCSGEGDVHVGSRGQSSGTGTG